MNSTGLFCSTSCLKCPHQKWFEPSDDVMNSTGLFDLPLARNALIGDESNRLTVLWTQENYSIPRLAWNVHIENELSCLSTLWTQHGYLFQVLLEKHMNWTVWRRYELNRVILFHLLLETPTQEMNQTISRRYEFNGIILFHPLLEPLPSKMNQIISRRYELKWVILPLAWNTHTVNESNYLMTLWTQQVYSIPPLLETLTSKMNRIVLRHNELNRVILFYLLLETPTP